LHIFIQNPFTARIQTRSQDGILNSDAIDWAQSIPPKFRQWDRHCRPTLRMRGRLMSMFVQLARMVLVAAVCCGPARADEHPSPTPDVVDAQARQTSTDPTTKTTPGNNIGNRTLPQIALLAPGQKDRDPKRAAISQEPFGLQAFEHAPSELSARWAELQSRIRSEEETVAACRSGDSNCPAAARRFLYIVELGLQRQGRARLGEINRAVNLGIRPVSDWAQYGVQDFWSAPLDTLSAGAGDCEDYAILKYAALRQAGIVPEDLRLVIVRDIKRRTDHAVVAVRLGEEWLLLDNRMLIMVNAAEAPHYHPLVVLDHRGAREFATAALRR
jgi:predicted transglutaminase-like cysteine proteinase